MAGSTHRFFSRKYLGPEDQAMVIPGGDLLCWSFMNVLKFQISNKKKMNAEHRTFNIEHRMWLSLRSFLFVKVKRRRRTIIRRWKFDVRCSFFRHKTQRQSHLSLTWPKGLDFQWKNKKGPGEIPGPFGCIHSFF